MYEQVNVRVCHSVVDARPMYYNAKIQYLRISE